MNSKIEKPLPSPQASPRAMADVEKSMGAYPVSKKGRTAQHRRQIERIKRDPFWFAREILGNEAVFPETLEECPAWKQLFEFIFSLGKDYDRAVVNSPRNTYKSTLLCAMCAWLICLDRNVRILYVTNVWRNAVMYINRVKAWLEDNEAVEKIFGTMRVKDKDSPFSAWRDDYFYVSGRTTNAKEPTFTTATTGQTITGTHFDFIFIDDPVDLDNTRTADALRNTINWYRLVPKLLDKQSKYGPGGCLLDCGTRYADGDIHGWLLGESDDDENPSDDYNSLVLESMDNPKWDEEFKKFIDPIFNFEFVLDEKRLTSEYKLGSYWFYTQYQNKCISPKYAIFRREQFKLIPHYMLPQHTRRYVLCDYAMGLEEQNDRTAIWVVALDWKRTCYCIDFDVGRWTLAERARRTIQYAIKHNAEAISLEQQVSNEGMFSELREQIERMRVRIRIEAIGGRSSESKKMRIISLQPRFENGRIFFLLQSPDGRLGIQEKFIRLTKRGEPAGDIVDEMIRFPKGTHDDIPDALSDIDKRHQNTGAYIFPGAMERGNFIRPELVNGRLQYFPQQQQRPLPQPVRGFWEEAAASYRR